MEAETLPMDFPNKLEVLSQEIHSVRPKDYEIDFGAATSMTLSLPCSRAW